MDCKFKFKELNKVFLLTGVILISFTSFVLAQVCDMSSDDIQCDYGEICKDNRCKQAISCEKAGHCNENGISCVTNYCQSPTCTSRGQCVHGQVCSRYGNGICLDPVNLKAPEGNRFKIEFTDPAPDGMKYREIVWMKENSNPKSRIVFFHEEMTNNRPQYFNNYCKTLNNCDESSKVLLNTSSGALIFTNVSLNDEGNYFYWFLVDSTVPDTGVQYQIHLEIYVVPKKKDVSLTGMPEVVEPNTEVELTCSVNRIKPKEHRIVWNTTIGQRKIGELITIQNKDGTYQSKSIMKYIVKEKHYRQKVQCTVVHMYGDTIYVRELFSLKREYKEVRTTTAETSTIHSTIPGKILPEEIPKQCISEGPFIAVIVILAIVVVVLGIVLAVVVLKKTERMPLRHHADAEEDHG